MMKKMSLAGIAVLLGALWAGAVETPTPTINMPLNEGDVQAIRDLGGNKVTVFNQEFLTWGDGPSGKALIFKNNDGNCKRGTVAVRLPEGCDLTKGFSVAIDAKLSSEATKKRIYNLVRFADSYEKGPGFCLFDSWHMTWFRVGNGVDRSDAQTKTSDEPIAPDKWYKIIAVYDGMTARIYLNGRLAAEKQVKISMPKIHRDLQIGSSGADGAGYGFDGMLANFKFFDCALTPEQVSLMSAEE